jgi:uncharacterized protein YgiM (DUF1202 family)
LSAGTHNFLIEYYEAVGSAFLNFNMTRQSGSGAPPPVSGPAINVTGAFRLNVRANPDPVNGAILTQIRRNETYPIVGRNNDTTWWQINVNGTIGWVSARFVTAVNAQNVPVVGSSAPPPTAPPPVTGAAITVTNASRLNVRNAPNAFTGQVLTRISRGDTFPIVGRNSDSSWWQINVNGTVGWINARYVTAVNAQNVPVTSTVTNTPGGAPQVVQCPGFLPSRLAAGRLARVIPGQSNNFRSQPTLGNNVIGQIPGGATFTVVSGPQCASNIAWWQVNFNGVVGWTAEGSGNEYWLELV